MEPPKKREHKTAIVVAIIGAVATILAAAIAIIPSLVSDEPPPAHPEPTNCRVGLTEFPEVESFVALLRQSGYHVDLASATPNSIKEDFSVITVGFELEPAVAAKLIRLTQQHMPWVRYICFQDPPADKTLFLNASNLWIEARKLKQLSDADFDLLTDKDQTIEEFHRLIAIFGG